MLQKVVILIVGVLAGALVALAVVKIQWRSPEVFVREPEAPGESRIEYTPPPEPGFSAEMLKKYVPMIRRMLNPEMVRVTDDVYVATGYAFANVAMVVTGDGLVIIDASESEEAAQEILAGFRKITMKPIRYIVYTHFHNDHTKGGGVFLADSRGQAEIIAADNFEYWYGLMWETLGPYNRWTAAVQSGRAEPDYAFDLPLAREPYRDVEKITGAPMPTITFEDRLSFTLGGKTFELHHTKGETHDHIAVWLPDQKVLFGGDTFYPSWPQLRTPMREPQRPVTEWAEAAARLMEFGPEYLVVGHGPPLVGADLIRETLANYREAILYIHDETVRYINEGRSAEEAAAEIRLPAHLAGLPYLQELYGMLEWSIKGIYHGYIGWYDGYGTGLNPLPRAFRAREVVALAGGADRVLLRAIELQKEGEHQLCVELCDIVIAANPGDVLAHRVKAASMHYLAYAYNNLNCFGFYRSAYSIHMKAGGLKPD